MNGGGDNQSPPLPGGEFLLQLLQRPPRQHHDPDMGPTFHMPHHRPIHSQDLTPQRPPPFAPHAYMQGYSQNPSIHSSSPPLSDTFRNLGLYDQNSGNSSYGFSVPSKTHQGNQQFNRFADNSGNNKYGFLVPSNTHDGNQQFNRFASGNSRGMNGYEVDFRNSPNSSSEGSNRVLNGYGNNYPSLSEMGEGSRRALNGVEPNYRNFPSLIGNLEGYNRAALNGIRGYSGPINGFESDFPTLGDCNRNQGNLSRGAVARQEVRHAPPGFRNNAKNGNFGQNLDMDKSSSNGSRNHGVRYKDERRKGVMPENKGNKGGVIGERRVSPQLDFAPPTGSALHSASGFEIEESMSELHSEIGENGEKSTKIGGLDAIQGDEDDLDDSVLDSLEEENGSSDKTQKKKRDKDYRADNRGQRVLAQWMRKSKRMIECRRDVDMLSAPLLAIYDSLVPSEEEKMKQKQLLASLEKLVINEWPDAQLLVYGSCANSFGVKKSDIDICLAMKDAHVNKSDILLRLADIFKAENLENVQALTHARVPIVKLMDPVTGISCDICVNNVLAVVNSKLLRDYAQIDARLRQLAFIVKHWAKLRGVNETYHGTLSSYAYVLMCIHYLQQCRPAILPCLQEMNTTYNVIVDNVHCAFFDQVEKLSGFGSRNRESIGQLLWGFFRYWAYCHDYAHDVVSVRLGCTISKRDKDWTRRVGNDRHLICIEDPFEMTHDLGRVVDKRSIKVLREEFERAAQILQFDPNPCVTLFEPYVPI